MESTNVKDGTAVRVPSQVHVRDGTTTREAQKIYVQDATGARLVYQKYYNMSLGNSGNVSGSCSTSTQSNCSATTGSVTVTVTNGRAPFTYSWAYLSGTSATINSPSAATTTFTRDAAGSSGGTQYVGTYRCTVTDATGRTATNDVTVTTTHTSTFSTLSASANVGSVTGSGSTGVPGANISVTTGSVTVTPSGGSAPYTYAWTNVSGTTATVNSATSATTTFTRNAAGSNGGTNYTGVYRCTVTDSAARTASVDVTVSTTHTNTYVTLTASGGGIASGSCSTNNGNGCSATTNSVTATPSGGAAPYTYSWSLVSGTSFTVNSASSATTSFSKTAAGSSGGTTYSATYRCTITDFYGYTATVDAAVSTTHTDTYTSLSVSADGSAVGSCSYTPPTTNCAAGTNTVNVSVSGGLAPYTYSWSYLSGTSATQNQSSTSWNWFSRVSGGTTTLNGYHRCTVTDATGRTASVDVLVQTTHTQNAAPLSASKSGDAYGECTNTNGDPCTATTNDVFVSAAGGTGPYSYSWSLIAGGSLGMVGGSGPSCYWEMSTWTPDYVTSTYRCTVTDSLGATAYVDVGVTMWFRDY